MKETTASAPRWTPGETISLSVVIFLIMIPSVLGNLVIILAFVKSKRLLSSFANKLVLSLAVADLATAAVLVNYQLAIILDMSLIEHEGTLCTIGGLASYAIFLISILTKVMLSIDRFIALGYPLKYNLRIKTSAKAFMITYPWIHGILFGIFCGILINIKFDPVSRDCGLVWKERHIGFTISVLIAHFVLPFGILVLMNAMTLRLVRSQNRVLGRQVSSLRDGGITVAGTDVSRRRAGSETKLAKMSMAIVLVFLLCWTPYIITRALSLYCCHVPSIVLTGAVITADLTSLINPIIYSSLRSDLRRSIRDLFGRNISVIRVHPVIMQVSNQPRMSQISECY